MRHKAIEKMAGDYDIKIRDLEQTNAELTLKVQKQNNAVASQSLELAKLREENMHLENALLDEKSLSKRFNELRSEQNEVFQRILDKKDQSLTEKEAEIERLKQKIEGEEFNYRNSTEWREWQVKIEEGLSKSIRELTDQLATKDKELSDLRIFIDNTEKYGTERDRDTISRLRESNRELVRLINELHEAHLGTDLKYNNINSPLYVAVLKAIAPLYNNQS